MSAERDRLSVHSDALRVGKATIVEYIQDPIRHADVCTCPKCNAKANRIAAFGAIRRAANVARALDAEDRRAHDEFLDAFDVRYAAVMVRRAIRAAIGSDNA